MISLGLFLFAFGFGPAGFWILTRERASRARIATLSGLAVIVGIIAFAMLRMTPTGDHANWAMGITIVAALWLSWVILVAVCALAARRWIDDHTVQQWTTALGAMATTLPWLGFQTAQMMAG